MLKIMIMALAAWAAGPVHAEPAEPTPTAIVVRVVDGDTVDIDGVRVRLKGIDTPETWRPRCERELALGLAAKARLISLLAEGRVWYAADGRDRWGRVLGHVYVENRSVEEVMLREGHAVVWSPGPVAKAARLARWCP